MALPHWQGAVGSRHGILLLTKGDKLFPHSNCGARIESSTRDLLPSAQAASDASVLFCHQDNTHIWLWRAELIVQEAEDRRKQGRVLGMRLQPALRPVHLRITLHHWIKQ